MSPSMDHLTFAARHGERLYLNTDRTHDRFTMQLGAISAWVTSANKEVGAGAGVVQLLSVQGKAGRADDVTYDITDPIAQALLLQTAVEEQRLLTPVDEAKTNEYVLIQGKSCLHHPDAPPVVAAHTRACAPAAALEARRATEEQWLRFLQPDTPHARAWLLIVQRGDGGRAAAVLDQKWLSVNATMSYAHAHLNWVTFGVLQDRIGGTPLVAPVSIFLAGK